MKLSDLKLPEELKETVPHLEPHFEAQTKEDRLPVEMVTIQVVVIDTSPDRINFKPYGSLISLGNMIIDIQIPKSEVLDIRTDVMYAIPAMYEVDENGKPGKQKSLPAYRITPKGLAWINHQIASAYEEVHEMWREDQTVEQLLKRKN